MLFRSNSGFASSPPSSAAEGSTSTPEVDSALTVAWNYTITPTVINELRIGYSSNHAAQTFGISAQESANALGLTDLAGDVLSDGRQGKNKRHLLTGLFRQSVFGRLAGSEDVNDAERLAHDPAMRAIVDRGGLDRAAASTSQMGRFETAWLSNDANLAVLTALSGAWIDRVHERRPQTTIVLDMDSCVSETHGTQEGSAYNGHFACMCYHPLFVFNQFGDLER